MEETKKKTIKKETIIAAVIGIVIGIAITCLAGFLLDFFAKSLGIARLKYGEEVVATVNGKSIKASDIYNKVKKQSGLDLIMGDINNMILEDMYQLSDKEKEDAKSQADYYLAMYAAQGYTQEAFLQANGFASYDDFVKDIETNLKSRKYLYDYLEKRLESGAIEKYYNEHKSEIETYDSEHVLVRIANDVTDEQALALINEILAKVNAGKTFEDIEKEYGDKIVHEELGFQGKNANLEEPYLTALLSMEDNSYSKEPVKTSYGYHIIHRKSTATMDDLRETIIEKLSEEELTNDQYLTYRAFVELRKEKNLTIYDEDLKKEYEEYVEKINPKDGATTKQTNNVPNQVTTDQ